MTLASDAGQGETPRSRWTRLLSRYRWAKRQGYPVRVQAKINGEWPYLGQR